MKTLYADFNAKTDAGQIRLTTRGSLDDLQRYGIRVGDWVWLSDGELSAGAKVVEDPRDGLVGVPAWDTLVHLDPEPGVSFEEVWGEIREIIGNRERTNEDESRLLQLLAWFEILAPQSVREATLPGFLDYRRASVLWALGHFELGLQESAKALEADPDHTAYLYLNIVFLATIDLERALQESHRLVAGPATKAGVLAQCVNVLAAHLDRSTDSEFLRQYPTLLDWIGRFQNAPEFETIPALLSWQVLFTQGMALLRKNQIDEAHKCFATILRLNPNDHAAQEAMSLQQFDEHARHLAEDYRARSPAFAA